VGENLGHRVEALLYPLGAPRKIEDEAGPRRAGNSTRQGRQRGVFEAGRSHQLGQPGGRSLDDLGRRLRRDVTGAEAGAAGRDHQSRAGVHLCAQSRGYCGSIVGDNHPIADGVAGVGELTFGEIAGLVLAGAVRDTVADGDDGDPEPLMVLDG
jgi:hypothetical protein